MTKEIMIEPHEHRMAFYDLQFENAFDDYWVAVYYGHPNYKLYHPNFDEHHYMNIGMDLNFFDAEKSIKGNLMAIDTMGHDQKIALATTAILYQQMLTYGSSGIKVGPYGDDATDQSVLRFKENLNVLIQQASFGCKNSEIESVQTYLSDQFKRHQKPIC